MDRRRGAFVLFEHFHKSMANDFATGDEACAVLGNGREPTLGQIAIVRRKKFRIVERQQVMDEKNRLHIGASFQPIKQKIMFAPSIEHVQIDGILRERPVGAGKPMANMKDLAERIASEFVGSVWFEERSPFVGIRSAPTNITRPRLVSFANVTRRIASEVAATLRLIQNRDKAD